MAVRAPTGKWVVAMVAVLGAFVAVMDLSIVNVAMPQMLGTFGVSLDAITWVAVGYSIAEIIMVTMAAWFSILLGRKRFFILSLVLFTTASVFSGSTRSLEMMIVGRVLQGIGGGGLIPVAQAIMLETFPEEERGMAMALYMVGVVVAPAVGPVLGGWLTDTHGWPWIFYINVPIGAFGILLATIVLTDPPHMRRALARIDMVGIGLLALGLTALQLFLERGERENWFESSFIVITALVALLALLVFVFWELWVEEPVVNLRVLNNLPFVGGTSLGLVFGMVVFASIFILPLFLERLRGYTVLESGLILMPQALSMMVFAPLAGHLYNRMDSRLLIGFGMGLMVYGYFRMAHFTLQVGWQHIAPILGVVGAGLAFVFSTMSAAAMRTMPHRLLTAASGLYTLARRVGGNIGYAFVANQIAHRTALHRVRLIDHLTPYDEGLTQTLVGLTGRLAGQGSSPGVAEERALKLLDGSVNLQATMMAYNDVFWMMSMLFILGLPFLLLLGSRSSRRSSS